MDRHLLCIISRLSLYYVEMLRFLLLHIRACFKRVLPGTIDPNIHDPLFGKP
jgi:hypothetical protein